MMIDLSSRLTVRHIIDLRASDLSDETIWKNGLFSASKIAPHDYIARLNHSFKRPANCPFTSDALLIPYDHIPSFESAFLRAKPDDAIQNYDGNEARYLSPFGAHNRLYFPKGVLSDLQTSDEPLIITEGEKKALKAYQEGFLCVALPGVSCWVEKPRDSHGRKLTLQPSKPIQDLDLITSPGRKVYIVFDSDAMTKSEVGREVDKLAAELIGRQMQAYSVRIPQLPEQKKTGLDDYLIARRSAALQALIEASPHVHVSAHDYNDLEHTLIQFREFPQISPDVFHGIAGEIVRTIEPHTESSSAALLVQLLVGFGNLIGRGPHFSVEADRHFTNMFAVLVGDTSKARKGTSWGHVHRLLGRIDPSWEAKIHSGLSTGEGLIWSLRDGPDTPENGVTDKRLMVIVPEFAAPLRIMRRDGSVLSQTLRDAWDGKVLETITKNSPAKATNTHVSIIGHVTRDELTKELQYSDCANGFGNRFLLVCVKRSKLLPEGGTLDPTALDPLAAKLRHRISAIRAEGVLQIELTPDARRFWREIYPDLSADRMGLSGMLCARAEAQTKRLALLYSLLDWQDIERFEIDVPHLKAARVLWDYCEQSISYIFGESSGNSTENRILDAVKKSGGGLSQSEIGKIFSGHAGKDAIGRALQNLETAGSIECTVVTDTRGRPQKQWLASNPQRQ